MKSRVRSFYLLGLLAALVVVALPASAGAAVYWSSNNTPNLIGRANLDGSGPNQDFIAGNAYFAPAVAVDPPYVYWTENQKIARAKLDGTEINRDFVPGAIAVRGITVSGSYIYWSTDNNIGRANLSGTEANNGFIGDTEGTNQIAVGGNRIYWTNRESNYIGSASLEGTDIKERLFEGESGLGIAADEDGVYFSDGDKGIGFMNFTGNYIIESDIPGAGGYGLAISGKYIYWAGLTAIGRANIDASEVNTAFITPASAPYDVAVDSSDAAPAPPGPPPPPTPSNVFSLGKAKLLKKSGSATLTITVPGPGKLVLTGKGLVKVTMSVKKKGSLALRIKPTKKTKATLQKLGKAKVTAKITFTPSGGAPNTETKTLTLKG